MVPGCDNLRTYNRQGQRISLTDQNGSVHAYKYDLLGRLTEDCVATLGSGIAGAVRRIEKAYEVRGMVSRVTSFDSPTVGSGSVKNEVVWTYNGLRQSVETFQSHSGAVNPFTTASVQMGYANGSANTIRPTSLTYPNGRSITSDYGTSRSITDATSQIASLVDSDGSSTHLADYSYLGLGSVVQQDSTQANLRYTLVSQTGSNDPDTGEIYSGLDRFGRVKDVRWRNTSTNTDLSRAQYGYNRASSRTWRANPTAPSNNYDWLCGYDGLQRVTSGTRGTLNGTKTGITSPQFGQCWTLDSTGNWQGFKQDDNGTGIWDLEQTRSASPVNEIKSIDSSVGESWATPQYDPTGNMTTIPRPGLPRPSWANLTVDQSSSLTVDQCAEMEVAPKFGATYDAWNRLVKLTDGGTGQTTEQYQYDGRSYRTVVQSYTSGTLSETRHAYYTDRWQCVEERLGTSPDSANPDRQFVWGIRYIDDLICRDHAITSVLNERLYACQDANWNMTAVVDISGASQERYEYDPYGNCTFLSPTNTARSASSYGWQILYAGYRFDSVSRLYLVRNRYYFPQFSAWLTRDPLGYSDSLNLYEYCGSNPQSNLDPLGLTWGSFWRNVALGALVGVAATVVVIVAAPVAITAGAAILTAAGVSAATATTVSTAVVTGSLFVAGTAGLVATGIDTTRAIQEGDWDSVGYNVGLLGSGYAVGGLGGGHRLVTAMGGKPSAAPRTLSPMRLCRYEYANRYQPNYPGGPSFFSASYWATAPTPMIGSVMAASACNTTRIPSAGTYLLDQYEHHWMGIGQSGDHIYGTQNDGDANEDTIAQRE